MYPPPCLREWRAKGVIVWLCFVFPACCFSVLLSVGMFSVGMFTVGLVLFVLKTLAPPPPHTLLQRVPCWCHILAMILLAYVPRCWLPFGIHVRTVFHHFDIISLSIVFTSILGWILVSLLMFVVETFSVRTRKLQNLHNPLF